MKKLIHLNSQTQIDNMFEGEYKELCTAAKTRGNIDQSHFWYKLDYTVVYSLVLNCK